MAALACPAAPAALQQRHAGGESSRGVSAALPHPPQTALRQPAATPTSSTTCAWGSSSSSSRNSSLQRHPRASRVACRAVSSDPYVSAVHRLFGLINGVGDGEDELYYSMLLEEDPASKLQVNAVLATACGVAVYVICSLCGADPAGGASLSPHSAAAAALGAAAAVPLVAYKRWAWSPEALRENATLSSLRRAQTDSARPWLSGMSSPQLALHLVLDTLPPLFLMLPAAQAAFGSSFAFSSAAIGGATGLQLPQEAGVIISLLLTGVVTAAVRSTDYVADPEQHQAVSDAVANADRYYRLMAGGSSSSSSSGDGSGSGSSQEEAASRAALAFKAVAVTWKEMEQEVMRLSMTLQVLDFLYLGALYAATHDMTAPCVAALLGQSVDYANMWRAVCLQPGRGGGSSSGGGGGSSSLGGSSSSGSGSTGKGSSLRD